ncbi:hypothetical protein LMG31841_03518 [Paraburkholderia saeva]|uniref:DNA circulation N-terminal domain-containing protein n=2 Tax=Paraburkholderia saeva TaxID=2777537 RepID=A0A9N8RYB8_9BURK|nr:hypothetical protein LMG31841_03518 [Paraburkholderia saeva]
MGTWRDRLQPASFRGVPFDVDGDSIGAGRRTQTHEYVKRDKPYVEDLGRATRDVDVTGFLIGDDCFEQADRLLEAFETAGPGELVHPWLGRMKVSAVGKPVFKRDRREGGMVRFDVSFVESGDLSFPATTLNTSQQLASASDALETTSKSNFATLLDDVNTARVSVASYMSSATKMYTAFSNNLSPFVSAFTDAAQFAQWVLNAPSLISEELFSAVDGITSSFTGTANMLTSVTGIFGSIGDVGSGSAPTGTDAAGFQSALVQVSQDAMLVMAMRDLATITVPVSDAAASSAGPQDPASVSSVDSQTGTVPVEYDEAGDVIYPVDVPVIDDVIALRDGLASTIWDMAQTASYDRFQALTAARQAITRHLNEVAKNGVRIVTIQPIEATPSLVLAYQRYGDATRADEIVTRNRVSNPGFVPPVELQVAQR